MKINLLACVALLGLMSVSAVEAKPIHNVRVVHPQDVKKVEVMKPLDRADFFNRRPDLAARFEECSSTGYCPGGN